MECYKDEIDNLIKEIMEYIREKVKYEIKKEIKKNSIIWEANKLSYL